MQLTISWSLFLDTLLMKVRDKTIQYASKRKKEVNAEEKKLIKDIDELESEISGNSSASEERIEVLKQKKNELESIRKYKMEGIIIRSRTKWYEEGEKNSKYFFSLEKRNYIEKQICKLIREDGEEIQGTKQILDEMETYYKQLYEDREAERDNEWVHNIDRQYINKLNDNEKDDLEGPLTYTELAQSVKSMKNNKTPGTDGFPVEFF